MMFYGMYGVGNDDIKEEMNTNPTPHPIPFIVIYLGFEKTVF